MAGTMLMCSMNSTKRTDEGFTLTELMITILILGLVAALALPTYGRFVQDWKLSGEADQFASALRSARSSAVLKNIDAVFTFDMDNNAYFYFEDNNRNGVRDHGEYRSDMFELYNGIVIAAHTLSTRTLTFGRMGNTRESGSITLRNVNNNVRVIRIFGGTGNVTID